MNYRGSSSGCAGRAAAHSVFDDFHKLLKLLKSEKNTLIIGNYLTRLCEPNI